MAGYRQQKQHAPVDDSVVLPAAIRAASARSDAIHKQMYEAPAAEPPVQTPPPAQKPAKQEEPTPPAQTPPAAEPPAQTPPQADNDADWQRRYEAMKGRYDSAQSTIGGLNNRISSLEGTLAAMQRQPPVTQQVTPDLTFKGISQEEKDIYGEELIDVAQRAAQEKISPELAELRQKITRLEGTVGSVAEQNANKGVKELYAHLDKELPNWRTINRDPKFIAWTNLPDPYSGAIRISLMKQAFDQFEAERVLTFFKGFLSDEAATGPVPSHTDTPPANGKIPLETFAAPGRAKAPAVAETPGAKETISQAQIAAFYLDVQKGKYRGNDAEKVRLEQMIFDAMADGRITP